MDARRTKLSVWRLGLAALFLTPSAPALAESQERIVVQQAHTGLIADTDRQPGLLATVAQDRTLKLWNPATGRLLRTIELGWDGANVALSPDGSLVAATSYNQAPLGVWKTETGELIGAVEDVGAPRFISFDTAGDVVVTSSFEGELRAWRIGDGGLEPEDPARLDVVAGSLTAGYDRLNVFGSGHDRVTPIPLEGVVDIVVAGSSILALGSNGTMTVLDRNGEVVERTQMAGSEGHEVVARRLALSPDGERVVAIGCIPDPELVAEGYQFNCGQGLISLHPATLDAPGRVIPTAANELSGGGWLDDHSLFVQEDATWLQHRLDLHGLPLPDPTPQQDNPNIRRATDGHALLLRDDPASGSKSLMDWSLEASSATVLSSEVQGLTRCYWQASGGPTDRWFACTDADGAVSIAREATPDSRVRATHDLGAKPYGPAALSADSDATRFAIVDQGSGILTFEGSDGTLQAGAALGFHVRPVTALVWAGDLLVSGSSDGELIAWDVGASSERWRRAPFAATGGSQAWTHSLNLSELVFDESREIAVSRDLEVWDLAAGRPLRQLDPSPRAPLDWVLDLRLANGTVTALNTFGLFRQWDARSGTILAEVPWPGISDVDRLHECTLSEDLSSAICQEPGGALVARATSTMAELWRVDAVFARVKGLAFQNDRELIVSRDGFERWNLTELRLVERRDGPPIGFAIDETGRWRGELDDLPDTFLGRGFATPVARADGKAITYIQNSATISSLEGGTHIEGPKTRDPWSLAYSPSGSILASGSYGMVQLWSPLLGEQMARYEELAGQVVTALTFSRDGARLAALGDEGAMVRDLSSDTVLQFWSGADGPRQAAAFSPDGQLLYGLPAGAWDIETGERVASYGDDLIGDGSMASAIAISPNGELLAVPARDGSVELIRLATGESVHLLAVGDGWITYAASGDFDANRKGGDLVNMVNGLDAFGIDQVAMIHNRPDRLLERLGTGEPWLQGHFESRHRRRLRLAGIDADQAQTAKLAEAPTVSSEVAVDGRQATLRYRAMSRGRDLRYVQVFVNDVPHWKGHGREVEGAAARGEIVLELDPGANKIEVGAIDDAGRESLRELTTAHWDGVRSGTLWFVGFGVSDYADDDLDLEFAHQDVLDLAGAFGRSHDYDQVYTLVYTNAEVTVDGIREARAWLERAEVDDTVVLFIAGHGVHDDDAEGTYYFLTHETELDDLAGTAASFDTIEELLDGIAPRRKLFLMDTCESGELDEETVPTQVSSAGARGVNLRARTTRGVVVTTSPNATARRHVLVHRDRYIYNDLRRRSGAIVLSSSSGGELSYESAELANGVFTETILHALNGAGDLDGDGAVSTEELRDFVRSEVSTRTGGAQNPTVDRDNLHQTFGFTLGARARATLPPGPPPRLGCVCSLESQSNQGPAALAVFSVLALAASRRRSLRR